MCVNVLMAHGTIVSLPSHEAHYRCPFPLRAWAELDKLQRNTALTGCAVHTSYAKQTNEYV